MADGTNGPMTLEERIAARAALQRAYDEGAPDEPQWSECPRIDGGHWRHFVHHAAKWDSGQLPCDCCTPETQLDCGDCMGSGRRLIGPRMPYVSGMIELENGLATIADLIGDFQARGGVEHLPERSRALVEELRDGLGEKLYELMGRLQDLEEDLRVVAATEHWPMGEPLHDEQQRAYEADHRVHGDLQARAILGSVRAAPDAE